MVRLARGLGLGTMGLGFDLGFDLRDRLEMITFGRVFGVGTNNGNVCFNSSTNSSVMRFTLSLVFPFSNLPFKY